MQVFIESFHKLYLRILVCWDPLVVGDGICSDNSNHLACNYDGGDCCTGIKGIWCSLCECKDTFTNYPIITESYTELDSGKFVKIFESQIIAF